MPGTEAVVLQDKVRMVRPGQLDIRVPDTRLAVDVVDEEGRRVPRAWVNALGEIRNSGPVDRYYFRSLYFREPNGVLFELATE